MTKTSSGLAFSTTQATVRNPDAYEKITRHDLAVQLSGTLTADSTALTSVSAYNTHILREYRDEENRSASNGVNGRAPNGLYLAEDHRIARTGLQIRQSLPLGVQTFTGGLFLDHQKVIGSTTMGSPATTVMAASLIDEIALGKKSVFAVYGRLDHTYNRAHWGLGSDVRLAGAGSHIHRRLLPRRHVPFHSRSSTGRERTSTGTARSPRNRKSIIWARPGLNSHSDLSGPSELPTAIDRSRTVLCSTVTLPIRSR